MSTVQSLCTKRMINTVLLQKRIKHKFALLSRYVKYSASAFRKTKHTQTHAIK